MLAYADLIKGTTKEPLKVRFKLDRDLFNAAKNKNHDAIAVVAEEELGKIKNHKLPRSVELNVLDTEGGILK